MMVDVRPEANHGLRIRLIAVLLALVAGTILAIGGYAAGAFERAVAPELNKRTRLIGVIVRAELQRALELGVQIDAIAGLDQYLSETLEKFAEVDHIVVRTAEGAKVASARRSANAEAQPRMAPLGSKEDADRRGYVLPILEGNRLVGDIQIDISPAFVRTRLRDVFLDVMVIALVATLLGVELTLALAAVSVTRPRNRVFLLLDEQRSGNFLHRIEVGGLGGLARAAERLNDHARDLAERFAALPSAARERLRALWNAHVAEGRPTLLRLADIGDIRLPLFLYVVATEVTVSFLPVYARALARPQWLSAELAAAAPLVFYLLAAAVLTPFSGRLSRRFGARRLFLWSVVPTVLSLAALAQASHVGEVTFWRGVMAVFYATATIACQEYALRASLDRGSARPMGTFVAVVYSGVFCGAALGGVVAGRFGFAAALLSGAALAALAGALAALMMRGTAGDAVTEGAAADTGSAKARRWGARLPALLFGLAVPMSAATAVFVWYLTPLMLSAAGSGPAEIARVIMLYYLSVVLLGPAVTALSDGIAGPRALVLCGAVLAGLALLSMSAWAGFWAVVTAMAGLGIGHTMMRAPLYALAQRIDASGATMAPLRLFERLGAIVGLGVCAFALPAFGADVGIRVLALVILLGALGYVVVELTARDSSRPQPD